MITAGIDAGIESLKIVIFKDGQIVGRGTGRSGGGNRSQTIDQVWNDTLEAAQLTPSNIGKIVATGQGKSDVSFANDRVVEPVADARAARFLYPLATSVLDVGADQTRLITLGDGNNIREVVLNQKCSAGLGIFLRFMARRLDMTLDEMSSISLNGYKDFPLNEGCTVFAELDALSLLNRNASRDEVAFMVTDMIAIRVNSILNDKIKPDKDSTVLVGGVSRNAALAKALERRSGINFLIPEQAEYAGALGAALIAAG